MIRSVLYAGCFLAVAPPLHAAWLRCSARFGVVPRSAGVVWFLGRALADTIDAGPGTLRADGTGSGHAGPGGVGQYRGQLVLADRLEPGATDSLVLAVQDAGGRVVLVGWDYDAACRTVARAARADWVAPGTAGLYSGILRPRAFWAGGLPTFDVLRPEFVPYPFPPPPWRERDTARQATAEELFTFVGALPRLSGSWEEIYASLDQWLQQWARTNPALAVIAPIRGEIGRIRDFMLRRSASFHRIKSPIAGTWRIEMVVGGTDTLRFYSRTAETPLDADYRVPGVILPEDAASRPPFSYNLIAKFVPAAPMLDSLHDIDGPENLEAYFELVTEPVHSSPDSTVWAAGLSFISAGRQLFARIPSGLGLEYIQAQRSRDTSAVGRLNARGLTERWHRLFMADSLRAPSFSGSLDSRFRWRVVRDRAGTVSAHDEILLDGVPLVSIRATRISEARYAGEYVPRRPFPK